MFQWLANLFGKIAGSVNGIVYRFYIRTRAGNVERLFFLPILTWNALDLTETGSPDLRVKVFIAALFPIRIGIRIETLPGHTADFSYEIFACTSHDILATSNEVEGLDFASFGFRTVQDGNHPKYLELQLSQSSKGVLETIDAGLESNGTDRVLNLQGGTTTTRSLTASANISMEPGLQSAIWLFLGKVIDIRTADSAHARLSTRVNIELRGPRLSSVQLAPPLQVQLLRHTDSSEISGLLTTPAGLEIVADARRAGDIDSIAIQNIGWQLNANIGYLPLNSAIKSDGKSYISWQLSNAIPDISLSISNLAASNTAEPRRTYVDLLAEYLPAEGRAAIQRPSANWDLFTVEWSTTAALRTLDVDFVAAMSGATKKTPAESTTGVPLTHLHLTTTMVPQSLRLRRVQTPSAGSGWLLEYEASNQWPYLMLSSEASPIEHLAKSRIRLSNVGLGLSGLFERGVSGEMQLQLMAPDAESELCESAYFLGSSLPENLAQMPAEKVLVRIRHDLPRVEVGVRHLRQLMGGIRIPGRYATALDGLKASVGFADDNTSNGRVAISCELSDASVQVDATRTGSLLMVDTDGYSVGRLDGELFEVDARVQLRRKGSGSYLRTFTARTPRTPEWVEARTLNARTEQLDFIEYDASQAWMIDATAEDPGGSLAGFVRATAKAVLPTHMRLEPKDLIFDAGHKPLQFVLQADKLYSGNMPYPSVSVPGPAPYDFYVITRSGYPGLLNSVEGVGLSVKSLSRLKVSRNLSDFGCEWDLSAGGPTAGPLYAHVDARHPTTMNLSRTGSLRLKDGPASSGQFLLNRIASGHVKIAYSLSSNLRAPTNSAIGDFYWKIDSGSRDLCPDSPRRVVTTETGTIRGEIYVIPKSLDVEFQVSPTANAVVDSSGNAIWADPPPAWDVMKASIGAYDTLALGDVEYTRYEYDCCGIAFWNTSVLKRFDYHSRALARAKRREIVVWLINEAPAPCAKGSNTGVSDPKSAIGFDVDSGLEFCVALATAQRFSPRSKKFVPPKAPNAWHSGTAIDLVSFSGSWIAQPWVVPGPIVRGHNWLGQWNLYTNTPLGSFGNRAPSGVAWPTLNWPSFPP